MTLGHTVIFCTEIISGRRVDRIRTRTTRSNRQTHDLQRPVHVGDAEPDGLPVTPEPQVTPGTRVVCQSCSAQVIVGSCTQLTTANHLRFRANGDSRCYAAAATRLGSTGQHRCGCRTALRRFDVRPRSPAHSARYRTHRGRRSSIRHQTPHSVMTTRQEHT
jgi:hypothetical protein